LAFFLSKLIAFFGCGEVTAPYADGALRCFTESFEVLTFACKLNGLYLALTFPLLKHFYNFFHLLCSEVCLLSNMEHFFVRD
jgi:hypothetical protein